MTEVWYADHEDAELLSCHHEGSTPEEAAQVYFDELDPEDEIEQCRAYRKPTDEEQAESLVPTLADDLLERLGDRAADEGGEVFDGWPTHHHSDPSPDQVLLDQKLRMAVIEYLKETGDLGPNGPWLVVETVDVILVDGKAKRA